MMSCRRVAKMTRPGGVGVCPILWAYRSLSGLLLTTLHIGESLDIQNLLVSEFFC